MTSQSEKTVHSTVVDLLAEKLDTIVTMLRGIDAPSIRSAIPDNLGISSTMLDEHAVLLLKMDLPPENATAYLFVHPSGDITQVKVYNNIGSTTSRDNRVQPVRHQVFPRVESDDLSMMFASGQAVGGQPAIEVALTGADQAIAMLNRRR